MRLIKDLFFLIILSFLSMFIGEKLLSAPNENLQAVDYKVAAFFGLTNRTALKNMNEERQRNFDKNLVYKDIKKNFSSLDLIHKETSRTIRNIQIVADMALRHIGEDELANELRKGTMLTEIGDHEPNSKWLVSIHEKIHNVLGNDICQYLRVHDLYILAYTPQVVFNPSIYTLEDYLDHFAGHMISRWKYLHTGLAGLVAYWTSQAICAGATYGAGTGTFICGPISSVVELVTNNRIAPPLGESIWTKYNNP